MKYITFIVMTLLLVGSAFAAVPDNNGPWADSVVSYTPGTGNIATIRSDATQALGIAENIDTINFVSLGFGGELILSFENGIYDGQGDDFSIVETSFGNPTCSAYPEHVDVYVSADGSTWNYVGTGCQDQAYDIAQSELSCVQYVKLVDTSLENGFANSNADGFDVDGIVAIHSLENGCGDQEVPEFGTLAALGVLGLAGLFIAKKRT